MDVEFHSGIVSKAVLMYTTITRYGQLMLRAVAPCHKSNFRSSENRTHTKKVMFHKTQDIY